MPAPNALSAAELASMRSDAVAAACDTVCVIQRKTRTRDADGSATETWAIIATVNVGMTQPTAGQLQNYDYLIGSLAAWQIRMPFGTNVQYQDKLVIAGQTLIVQVVLAPRSYSVLLTVLASEIK